MLLYLLSALVLSSCTSRPQRFGVIFTLENEAIGPVDIYRIPDNTQSKVEQLTFTPAAGEYHLQVSKDGDKIIFQTGYVNFLEETSVKQRHVYLLDITSKELIDITSVLVKYEQVWDDFSMDWSPDQKQFVMVNHEVAGSEIESFLEFVDFDGENRKDILIPTTGEIPAIINGVMWSPDGRKFVLTQGVIGIEQQQYPGSAILMYDLESGKIMQITDYQDHCLPREWSPSGRKIVATCSYIPPYNVAVGVSGPETVRILDVENPGQPYERIAFSPCYDPSWSPDGKRIVFVCDKDKDHKGIFVVNSDGNGIREVKLGHLGSLAVLKNPTWSPDGTQIIYLVGTDVEHANIYSIRPDGSNNRPLTNQEGYYSLVSVYPLP